MIQLQLKNMVSLVSTSLFIFIGEDATLLYLLPLLLKTKKKIALLLKKNTFWKPYKLDMQEAFVIHVQNPEDVLVTISRKEEKLSQMFLSMQPFEILQRKDLLNIAQIIEGRFIRILFTIKGR
ncbi:hypothetical protein Avbf_16856 [Armadillidium vulgare]|nr:hypothetical protein Avbf_16856 [Armadillidium vulgare]